MPIRSYAALAASALALVSLSACKGKQQAPAAPPPVEVAVLTLKPQRVSIATDLPGRTVAFRVAEVRPQVSGVITKRYFEEGGEVKAGQPLYQIDPALFEAALATAKASLASAEASANASRSIAERYKPLAQAKAVSQQEFDNAVSSQLQAEAAVATAKAQISTAQVNLRYTRVLSPISGRAGRALVTEGALVTANQTQALVTIQQLDPIYVDLTQSSSVLLRLRRQLDAGQIQKVGNNAAAAKLKLEDGTAYGATGELKVSEVSVDPGTGSVALRAVFPNPDKLLLPGMFVHAEVEEGVSDQALLVPQAAISVNAKGQPYALVLGADNKVEQRTVKTERAIGTHWLISEGLKAGEKVVVENGSKVQPGAPVKPHEAGTAPAAAPAAAAPAAQTH